MGKQSTTQRQHLLLTAGHRACQLAPERLERRKHVIGAVGGTLQSGSQLQVLVHGQLEEEATVLGDVHHTPPGGGVCLSKLRHRLSEYVDRPLEELHDPGDRPQRRRLSGAVGAEQCHDLAPVRKEIQITDDGDTVVACVHTLYSQHPFAH